MKIQDNAAKVFIVFFKDPWTFLLGSLAAIFLSAITLGILAPVMWLGMGKMFLKTRDGQKATLDDLFTCLDRTLMLAMQFLTLTLCVAVGMILIVPGIVIAALWMYSPYFLAEKNTGIIDSFKLSARAANKNSLITHVVMLLVLSLIMASFASTCVGLILAYPAVAGFMAFMYEEVELNQ